MKRVFDIAVIIVALLTPLIVSAEESGKGDVSVKEKVGNSGVFEDILAHPLQNNLWILKTDSLGDTLFTKTYGEDSEYRPYALDLTDGGGFTVAGREFPHPGRAKNFFLRFDSLGDTLWSYSAEFGEVERIHKTPDGDYIVLGMQIFGYDSLPSEAFKIDSLGDTLWTGELAGAKIFGDVGSTKTFDGGIIMIKTGPKKMFLSDVSNCLVKTDSLGDALWVRTFGRFTIIELNCVEQTRDSGFIMTGLKGGKLWLLKTDSKGRIQWRRRYGEGKWINEGFQVMEIGEGNYLVAGRLSGVFSLFSVNAKGRIVWQKEYSSWFHYMERTSDDCFVMTGTKNEDLWLLKVDMDGSVLWEKSYGNQYYDTGKKVKETSDEGYLILGVKDTRDWKPGHNYGETK
ncbi:hypothetical protein GF359_05670 [candidate division WOR-3 bacterium]|uniref:Uncharacterized protein n=1 Tax=candidate division WOR-3 bacterium TaxID=2052148 RepID=A0A9D5K9L5_UNCW3|nr:hypothetical protein [candidate division WOR-3 bacterium]MBD3364685.1 hypothetical protein [candidate division WOR-3 bacterium]